MARYIDADAMSIYFDAFIKHAETEGLYNMAHVYERCLRIVKDTPTADVAPRAEVAREIFEEIEDALESCYDPDIHADYPSPCYNLWLADRIAELKKEYTDVEPPKGDHHE